MAISKTTALYVVVGFLSLSTVAFMVAVIVMASTQKASPAPPSPVPKHNVSDQAGWIAAAKNIRLSIDPRVNPCDDFYKFACGAWIALNPIPASKGRFDSFTIVRDRVKEMTKQKLDELAKQQPTGAEKMLKSAYLSCMNETNIERHGSSFLRQEINSFPGGWPVLNSNWDPKPFDVSKVVATLSRKYGVNTILSASVFADQKDTAKNIFYLDQATLGFGTKSEDYYLSNESNYVKSRQEYVALMQNVTGMLIDDGIPHSGVANRDDFEAILGFEVELARINIPASERRNESQMYNLRKISELNHMLPSIDWKAYFAAFQQPMLDNPNEQIVVVAPSYMKQLDVLLQKTDKRTIANYLIWRLILDRLTSLNKKYVAAIYRFYNVIRGTSMPSRDDFCLSFLIGDADDGDQYLAYAVGRVFVDSYFTAIAKNDVTSMVDQLLNAFKKLVKELQWMDEATKTRALEKAENMWKNIGYPDFIKDNALLDKYYNLLSPEIKENEPFYRVNSVVQEWMMSLQMNDLTKPFNRKSFGGSPAIVNAWYSNLKNSITFPAGILQFPFFDATYPKAVNYGAIGSVIGHEITHGFDDQGSQYNASGDLQNWWSESSALHFDKKTQCMKEQYDHYCYPQLNKCVQGDTTLGENIADNGGLKEAFTAYQTYVAEHGEELRLPSLAEYSMDQIFFISFASFWCGSYKDNFLRNLLSTNEHAPNEFRVKGVVQNSKEFAEAFNCPLGSPMNPEHKCTVW